MTKSTVTLRVNDMPMEMRTYGFPCGETNCTKTADMEFVILTLEAEYKMPICKKHAKELIEDASLDRV